MLHTAKKRQKITPGAFRMDFLTKNVSKSHFGHPPTRFEKGLGPPWRTLGGSWVALGALGWLLGALGRLLGASWESLGRSWLPPGCQMLPKRAPGSILKGSENVRGGTRRSQSYFFHTFYVQSAGHACSAIASFCAEGLLRKTICLRRCVVCPLRAWTY